MHNAAENISAFNPYCELILDDEALYGFRLELSYIFL